MYLRPATESRDVLIFEEQDDSCVVSLELSASRRFLVIKLNSQQTSETHMCPIHDLRPESLFCVRPRVKGVDYSVAGNFEII